MEKARNFRNYKVWQDAVDYSTKVYQITDKMPWFEKKGLCDQLQRAAVSISSNIAEPTHERMQSQACLSYAEREGGRRSQRAAKPSNADFARFLDTALGSAYEVETQLLIAYKVGYVDNEKYNELYNGITEIQKQLAGLIRSLRQ